MARRLARHLGPATSLARGQWSAETASGEPAVSCPECGEITEIEYPHEVDKQSGRVRYRWACPSSGCGFVEFLVLESFGEEVLS